MTSIVSANEWEEFYKSHPEAHLLQSPEWGRLKSNFGWTAVSLVKNDSGAQILFKALPLNLSMAYIPKGPVGGNWMGLFPEIDEICRQKNAIFVKIEPDLWEEGNNETGNLLPGYSRVEQNIQPRRTILIRLDGGEEQWLAGMKQKTRYNIKLAERKEIKIEFSKDVKEFYRLAQVTGKRDGFGVHTLDYYQKAFDLFIEKEECALLIARYNKNPLAGLMVFRHGKRSWYLYGASNNEERNRMPTYLLQYAAMKWAYERGCQEYDLWGVPDFDEETLEANFLNRSDGLWGVYRFKRGFGGKFYRSAGSFEKACKPVFYRVYQLMMKQRGIQAG